MAIVSENLGVSSSIERVRGFRFTLFEAGIAIGDDFVVSSDSSIKAGKKAAAALIGGTNRPTAIFCCNDLLAIGALQAAKEAGIRVPEQLSIIGFDDTILSTVTNPALSTIAQPMDQMVKLAFGLLIGSPDDGEEIRQRIVMPPALIARESTGIPPRTGD
jgi:LacI family transcriptional regulator